MMNFSRWALRKIKLFVLYWTRIVFVRNDFKVPFYIKLKANIFGGYLGDQYMLYDFKHNDKKEYLSEFDWYRSRYINYPFDFAFNNKVICTEIFKDKIKFADTYFIINKGILHDFNKGPCQYEEVISRLRQNRKLIIKPFALGKGNGVYLVEWVENGNLKSNGTDVKECFTKDKASHIRVDGKSVSNDCFTELLEGLDQYMICEYMRQHRYSDELYDKTTNTIRFITLRDTETHKMKVFFAVQRIGTSDTIPVDNGSKGGLVAKIDLATGTLSEARCLKNTDSYDFHPDSLNPIKGVKIPGWTDIKQDILDLCDQIPYMDFIAWDLLITDEGVCVIEANNSSGINIIQLWGGQRNGELGDFFRHYGVIK